MGQRDHVGPFSAALLLTTLTVHSPDDPLLRSTSCCCCCCCLQSNLWLKNLLASRKKTAHWDRRASFPLPLWLPWQPQVTDFLVAMSMPWDPGHCTTQRRQWEQGAKPRNPTEKKDQALYLKLFFLAPGMEAGKQVWWEPKALPGAAGGTDRGNPQELAWRQEHRCHSQVAGTLQPASHWEEVSRV